MKNLLLQEYFEEKAVIDGTKDATKVYWSSCDDTVAEKIKNNLTVILYLLSL